MENSPNPLNPVQTQVFDDLLAVGADRPVASASLVDELSKIISSTAGPAVSAWSEPTFFLGKSGFAAIRKCEGMVLAEADQPRIGGLILPTAVGIVTHRAIQMSYTHSDLPPAQLVRLGIAGSMGEGPFAQFMEDASEWERSELTAQSVNRLVAFLDSFPALQDSWVPRFEVSYSTKIGGLTLAGKPDLTLGRPRNDGKQTMFLCDFKTGTIRDDHIDEARFYALVATLRHGIPPFRSCVYSLSSGEWTDPDITADILLETAQDVADAVVRRVEVLSELRAPTLVPDRYCSWCPAAKTCPESQERDGDITAGPKEVNVVVESKTATPVISVEENPYDLD